MGKLIVVVLVIVTLIVGVGLFQTANHAHETLTPEAVKLQDNFNIISDQYVKDFGHVLIMEDKANHQQYIVTRVCTRYETSASITPRLPLIKEPIQ